MPNAFTPDANTIALYNFAEALSSDAVVDSVNGYNCASLSATVRSVAGPIDRARQFFSGAQAQQASQVAALHNALAPGQSCSFGVGFWPREGGDSADPFFQSMLSYTGAGAGDSVNARAFVVWASNGRVGFGHHSAGHVTQSLYTPLASAPYRTWKRAWCVRQYTGSQYNLYIYLNGVLAASQLNVPAPFDGSTDLLTLGGFTNYTADAFWGDLFFASIHNKALSAAEVLTFDTEVAENYAGFVAPNTAPVFSVVPPPSAGDTISHNTPIVVQATDVDANIQQALLLVSFGGSTNAELAWDGNAFTAQYEGSASETIAGGTRFTLRRKGGWKTNPSVRGVVYDARGLEA